MCVRWGVVSAKICFAGPSVSTSRINARMYKSDESEASVSKNFPNVPVNITFVPFKLYTLAVGLLWNAAQNEPAASKIIRLVKDQLFSIRAPGSSDRTVTRTHPSLDSR